MNERHSVFPKCNDLGREACRQIAEGEASRKAAEAVRRMLGLHPDPEEEADEPDILGPDLGDPVGVRP